MMACFPSPRGAIILVGLAVFPFGRADEGIHGVDREHEASTLVIQRSRGISRVQNLAERFRDLPLPVVVELYQGRDEQIVADFFRELVWLLGWEEANRRICRLFFQGRVFKNWGGTVMPHDDFKERSVALFELWKRVTFAEINRFAADKTYDHVFQWYRALRGEPIWNTRLLTRIENSHLNFIRYERGYRQFFDLTR